MLLLGNVRQRNLACLAAAAPFGAVGESLAAGAKTVQQIAERLTADARCPRQPDPVDEFGVVEGHDRACYFAPMRGSSPLRRRPRLALWRTQPSTAKTAKAAASSRCPRARA